MSTIQFCIKAAYSIYSLSYYYDKVSKAYFIYTYSKWVGGHLYHFYKKIKTPAITELEELSPIFKERDKIDEDWLLL